MIVSALLSAIHVLTLALGLGAVFARGRALARPLDEDGWRRRLAADSAWGAAAALWIASGVARVFFGGKTPGFYWQNGFFWVKLALFALVFALEGDRDVFGDGSVMLLATPGHTPGHQSLLVKLPKTGAIVLSGDAVHFKSNWENRGVPSGNTDKDKTVSSMQRIADVLAKEKAQLWINHDKAQRDTLKMAPGFYD